MRKFLSAAVIGASLDVSVAATPPALAGYGSFVQCNVRNWANLLRYNNNHFGPTAGTLVSALDISSGIFTTTMGLQCL